MSQSPCGQSSQARAVRTLKDGYWDITEVIALADGSLRVRKRNKGSTAPGPWGIESLRREINYLQGLSGRARSIFPTVLATWDSTLAATPAIGYEMPFYERHMDAGELARRGTLSQADIDVFQDHLADAVVDRLHETMTTEHPLSQHMATAMRHALDELSSSSTFAPLLDSAAIELNGQHALGPRAALDRIVSHSDAFAALDATPTVRLHGDFFLENILWSPLPKGRDEPRLILVDPVSVAGISCGPALFDLVKYESYATGELLALRTERVEVDGFAGNQRRYRWRIRSEDPSILPFSARDWHGRFRTAFEARHGPADPRLRHLIDGYFSLAMALNTTGLQQQARLLKATTELNAVLT
ncbi:MAG: phosphotransferase [Opitutus sp.]